MQAKRLLINTLSKIARGIGILAIIYICMVLYLVLSERHIAFPRAEANKTARASLPREMKSCETDDGKKLQGWISNDSATETIVYFADVGEDAATFLSEASKLKNYRIAGFNYRGSAGSEGTPEEKYFESDSKGILNCVNGKSVILIGRGFGSILAYNFYREGLAKQAILIDPMPSIASGISSHYKIFFPEFLVRTKISMQKATFPKEKEAYIIQDSPERKELVQKTLSAIPGNFIVINRGGKSLLGALNTILDKINIK
ncbi:MAG: hypothetical protein M0P13_01135 [Fibrobacteraceae bacterium]|nr:hypothetical protein [Fibrobacteraceae bacterium]